MPYKSEKIKLSEHQDRRIKLTSVMKEEIRRKYSTGLFSLMDLAKEYNVSKKSILLMVNPESKTKNDNHIKSHWKDYKPSLEERNKIMKEHRHYKQELYLKGKLK